MMSTMTHTPMVITDPKMRGMMSSCADTCLNCERMCLEVIPYSLDKGGDFANVSHILMLQNCAKICGCSAHFLLTGSRMHMHTCKACAEVCYECIKSCEKFKGDKMMMDCVDMCRKCADSCADMAQMKC